MKRAMFAAILACVFSAGVMAQAKPDFSGSWTLDAEKSVMPQGRGGGQGGGRQGGMGGGALTIAVEGQKMSVARTMGQSGNMMTTVYMLDGAESKNMLMGRGGSAEAVYKSRWGGARLVTTITGDMGTATETRWLEADGTMVVETTRTGRDGAPMTAKLVYRKN